MEVYKLSKPIEFNGETITEISLDLEGLSVSTLEKAEREARAMLAKKEIMFMPESNKKYLSCVAAKAAGVKIDMIKALSGKDYTQVCLLVQNFLLDGDSGSTEDSKKQETEQNTETLSSTRT